MNRLMYSLKTVFRSRVRSILLMLLVFLVSVLLCIGWMLKIESDKRVLEASSAFRIIGLFSEENQQVDLWEEEYQYLKGLDYIEVEEPVILSASNPLIQKRDIMGLGYGTSCAYSKTEDIQALTTENQCVFTFRYEGDGYGELVSILEGRDTEAFGLMQVYNYTSYQEELETNQVYIAYGEIAYNEFEPQLSGIKLFDFGKRDYCGVEKDADRSDYWEEICYAVRTTGYPLTVMSTQLVEDICEFHENDVIIQDGESFHGEMYDQGQKVCLINSKLASQNELQVGDKINLTFYESDYMLGYRDNWAWSIDLDKTESLHEHITEEEFIIVGTYSFLWSGDEYTEYNLNERTVLVPEKTMHSFFTEDAATDYQVGHDVRGLQYVTIHLKPQDLERFMQDTSRLVSLQVKLYDQGYSQIKNSLKSFQELANVLLSMGIICAGMVGCFVGYFEGRARVMERKVFRALGFTWKEIVLRFTLSLALICLPGMLAGWGCGHIASEKIMADFNQEENAIHLYEGISVSQ